MLKNRVKSFEDGRLSQDICKDIASNMGPRCWLLRQNLSRVKLFFSFSYQKPHCVNIICLFCYSALFLSFVFLRLTKAIFHLIQLRKNSKKFPFKFKLSGNNSGFFDEKIWFMHVCLCFSVAMGMSQ